MGVLPVLRAKRDYKRILRVFSGAFCITVILFVVLGTMVYCETNAQMTGASGQSQLLGMETNDQNQITLVVMGRQLDVDCTPAVYAENLRRRYYYLQPTVLQLLEQLLCYTTAELGAAAEKTHLPIS